jgi:hypothetical protein
MCIDGRFGGGLGVFNKLGDLLEFGGRSGFGEKIAKLLPKPLDKNET